MKKRGDEFYNIFGADFRRVTSIIGRLRRYGLDEWQASCAVDFMMSEFVLPLQKGWMSIEQLRELDLQRSRRAAMDESRRRMKEAQGLGRDVHDAIHKYYQAGREPKILDQLVAADPEIRLGIEAFRKWERDYHVDMVATEKQVFSFSRKYAGTLDLLAGIVLPEEDFGDAIPKVRLYVVDFKTGGPEPLNVLQLAAYVVAVEEMERKGLDGAGLVYLDKETGVPKWKGYKRDELLMPFLLFEKIKSFIELEDEWKGKGIDEGDRPSDTPQHTSTGAPHTPDSPAGSSLNFGEV